MSKDDAGTLTDEELAMTIHGAYAHDCTESDACRKIAAAVRDFRAPMPSREQIEGLREPLKPLLADDEKFRAAHAWNAALDAVLALFDKSEATDR